MSNGSAVPVVPVDLEVGNTRVFACALDWPGWCRRAKTDEEALEALASYAPRYALPRYAARRIAWHVLDHAWEIEDRS